MPTPAYALGRHTTFAVRAVTIDSAGTVTLAGSGATALGKVARAERRHNWETERIEHLYSTVENNVPIVQGWVFALDNIELISGTPLADMAEAYTYAQITVTRSHKIYVYTGVIRELALPTNRGQNVETWVLIPIEMTGAANPTITAVP